MDKKNPHNPHFISIIHKIKMLLWTKNCCILFLHNLSTSYPLLIHIFIPVNKVVFNLCGFVDKYCISYCHFKADLISYCCFIWWISNNKKNVIHKLWITWFLFPHACGNKNDEPVYYVDNSIYSLFYSVLIFFQCG